MPAYGEILEEAEIRGTVEFVLYLSGADHNAPLAKTGAAIFEEQCSACHGETGLGDPDQGAPNLTDAIWLYGGAADVNAVAAYVHGLGGGE